MAKDWEWLGQPWRRYRARSDELYSRYKAAREERQRAEREAREKAAREARERAERAAGEQAQADAERERSEREWRKKTNRQQDKPLTDYEAAVALLKLPESFTRQAFNKAYRKAMASAHPDAGGSTARAQAVNAARDLIRKRQGWK